MVDVAVWLGGLGLGEYARVFVENDIDEETLRALTAEDLKELGVSSLGHRKRLLAAIAELSERPDGSPAQRAAPSPPVEGERRQVTVLFADLAGYTALTRELGDEAVHAFMARFFEVVDTAMERFGGTIDKHIGDCSMAVFGAPVAHGNDPERAVRAALAIRDAMPPLGRELGRSVQVHIGIASGQVVASGTGSTGHREYTVTGESVNLASRLTEAAKAGEILISDALHGALAARFECAAMGELTVKGFAQPVETWRLLGLRTGAAEARAHPFVGRRAELHQFEGLLAACRETGCGQAVHVRGEAGIGKTRLVEEFQHRAEAAGFACHGGLVLDFGTGSGQDAIRAIVRSLLGLGASAEQVAVEAAAARVLADGALPREMEVFLHDLLDLPPSPELRAIYDAMDNATRNRGKRETVAHLVRACSAGRPLMLAIEDVHWADPLTLEHVGRLAETVADCPALLVMTSRIEGDPLDAAWRSRIGGTPLITMDLGPLRQREAEVLASAFLNAASDFARRCVERAAGNPLFLEQLLRHAEQRSGAGVPGSVQSLVQARMDQLEPADKQALQAASVFGQRFSLEGLQHILRAPDYDCARLAAHFLVRRQGEGFLFAHAMIRDAVYDSLLSARRRELHGRAADWFAGRDPVLHAEHLDRAEDPRAARAYLDAARAQAVDYHYERALRLVERGLELALDQPDRFALTCLQGGLFHDLGLMPPAREAYEAALAAAPDERGRCQAWIGLASVKRVTDDLGGAFADLAQAEAVATPLGLTAEQARIHFLRGNLFFPRGDIERCLEEHHRSLELARHAGSPELEAQALGGLGDAEYARGRMITAFDRFRRCVELCRAHGFGRIEVANFSMFGHTQLYFRPQGQALQDALTAAEAAARAGHQRAELNARLAAFFALYELGDLDSARQQVLVARALVQRLGARRFEQPCLLYLGKIALAEGRRAQAIEALHEALAIARETGTGFHGPGIVSALAETLEDPRERRELLAEGDRMMAAGAVGHNHLRYFPDAADLALRIGDLDLAERYTRALEDYTRPEPLPWSEFFIARTRALMDHTRGERDVTELERLREEARRLGLILAIRPIDRAVGAC